MSSSSWELACKLEDDEVASASRDLADLRPAGYERSRFLTIIGSSNNVGLNLMTSFVEIQRFSEKFGNTPEDMEGLYGHLDSSICILVVDTKDNNPRPASSARRAVARADEAHRLPTLQAVIPVEESDQVGFRDFIWYVGKEDYESGMQQITEGQKNVFDGSTIASLPEYSNGLASIPIFNAYARAAISGYSGFNGVFLSTIVKDVAGLIDSVGGFEVLKKFPGTTYEDFYGAANTAPHIGRICEALFSPSMVSRVGSGEGSTDLDNSTYVFLE